MTEQQIEAIKRVNYWEQSPKQIGFERSLYLQEIKQAVGSNLLKVLVGQRRSGKSFILKQFISHLLENGIPANHILYLNFELHELHFIQTHEILAEVIAHYFQTQAPQGKVYLFLDDIQEVEAWEKTVNSYLANERFDIEFFLTGSNAHLLSTELSTYLTGRYIEIPVYPFSFPEYCHFKAINNDRKSLLQYLEDSGIPELFSLKEKLQKINYLTALKDGILMNDIIKRFNIKNPKLLALLLDFLIDNIGKLFSINAIAKKLESIGLHINLITLSNYLTFLELTFLVHAVPRYDLKGKKILEGERKYYLNDLGFSNYLQSSFDNNITRRLENYVYLTLIQAGYKVHVGNFFQLEIDFVAEKNQETLYVQVSYLLHSEEVIQREYGNLEKIKDNWPKYVISLDEVSIPPKNGILHMPAWKLENYLHRTSDK